MQDDTLLRIDPLRGPWPLHDAQASRLLEAAAGAAATPGQLMERAGLAVARLALALAPHAQRIHVWSGPGNNGGDGAVAARYLHAWGRSVQLALLADPLQLPTDAEGALRRARDAGVPIVADAALPDGADLVIDALLGLGARRAPQGPMAVAIEAINRGAGPVLAVDLPSGLHPDTGALLGAQAVRASATLALLTLKPGLFTAEGRDHAGTAWLDALGVAPAGATASLTGPAPRLRRRHASHKGSFGDVAVVGGAPGMVGAVWLAARAAGAAGAGRVYCSPLDPAASLLDPLHPELMGRPAWWQLPPPQLAIATVVCGCGGGDAVRAALPPLLAHAPRLVLDADALNAVAADPALQPLLRARAARGLPTLLTPHPLEAARLLQCAAADVQRDRLGAAAALATAFGCCVLLKGSGSIVAAPGLVPRINPTGNAALASAGTGDVLAGWCGGLWAAQPATSPADIASAAAWQHGRAADRWAGAAAGQPLPASDLVGLMAAAADEGSAASA